MKKIIAKHVERAKSQPHHIKKRIVMAVAGTCTALVALVWLAGSLAFGSFAIKGSNFAASAERASVEKIGGNSGQNSADTGLAGAVSAMRGGNAAHIEIVDTSPKTSSTTFFRPEQTVIPF